LSAVYAFGRTNPVDANAEAAARALVREMVRDALRRIGTAKKNAKVVVPVLREALKDKDAQVRTAVAEVPKKIDSEAAKPDGE
jgi:HEAT repeat protein